MSSATARWEAALARWGWPQELLDTAPADPWSLGPQELSGQRRRTSHQLTPADTAARDALPRRGSVLDVGCGTGDASASLRRRAGRITGVDSSRQMLEVFAARTTEQPSLARRLVGRVPEVRTVHGRWPDVADAAETADVVLAHNVLYNVTSGVGEFLAQLTAHARHMVVVALTARHPLHWVNPYAEHLHGIRRPAEPTSAMAGDMVREVSGATPTVLAWTQRVDLPDDDEAFLGLIARRVCARPEQHDELRTLLRRIPPPTTRPMVSLVWPGTADH